MQVFGVYGNFLTAVFHILFGGFAAQTADFALQIAHTGFAHIFTHNQRHGVFGNFQSSFLQPVQLHLFGN